MEQANLLWKTSGYDLALVAAIFPSTMGFLGGMSFIVKTIMSSIVIRRQLAQTAAMEMPPIIREVHSTVSPKIIQSSVVIDNPKRLFQEISNIPKGNSLVTFQNGIEVIRTSDGYFIKTNKVVYSTDDERFQKIKYSLGELGEMVRMGQ